MNGRKWRTEHETRDLDVLSLIVYAYGGSSGTEQVGQEINHDASMTSEPQTSR